MCKCSCALHPSFPPEPTLIMQAREKTIKPKIIIINLNPRMLASKGTVMCHNDCLYPYYIKMCKNVLSKTEFMLFAVKLESISHV